MKLVMTLKVRDEEDVLADNLRFHHALGVDFFVVTDNGSVDGTPAILERYREAGLAHVISERSDDLRTHGAEWYTRMGRMAASELGADWVFHNDADEFWWPVEGNLKDALGSIAEPFGAVVCPRTEFAGRPDGPGSFAERLTLREPRSSLQPKVIHRADPEVVVLHRGAHEVAAGPGGDVWEALRPPGRAVHRTVRGGRETAHEDLRLVWAPSWPVRILHFPVRSFQQFRRRTEVSLRSGGFRDAGRFRRLREHAEAGRLDELYAELVTGEEEAREALAAGRLVSDERLARLLPRCPDPLSGVKPGSVRVAREAGDVEVERRAVEIDAMRLMSRTQRFTMLQLERSRRRIDELRARVSELESEREPARGRRGLRGLLRSGGG